MYVRRLLPPLLLTLFAIGCTDSVGVRSTAAPPGTPHLLRWSGNEAPQFSAVGSLKEGVVVPGPEGVFLGAPNEISLDQNTAKFWAVRGQERSVQINYRSSTGETTSPFLRLVTHDPAYVPGRGELAQGDSVLVTVSVDPSDLKVSFEPTGLRFGNPSQFQIFYGGAGGDLNGDGVVNDADAQIEHQLLGLWYREGSTATWSEIPASQSVGDKSFTSELQHFSEYAVSWLVDYAVSW